MKVLITGGAGFIGRHLASCLIARGDAVTVLDNFSPQIHDARSIDAFASTFKGTLIRGDVRQRADWQRALSGQDAVVHLAAETGTGQSMYAVAHYEAVNVGGTALMLDCLVNDKARTVQRLVVASSRAIYGEGAYTCRAHGKVFPAGRAIEDLCAGFFEPRCPACGQFVTMAPTSEDGALAPTSLYGLTKQIQEQMVLMYGRVLGIQAFALRYQNVYGPGQSLDNPYTGILAIFSNLARQGKQINVFEDGLESRDFVYIDDVVKATTCCLEPERVGVHSLNVGSGVSTTVAEVAQKVVETLDSHSQLKVSGAFRIGDIRHNVADLRRVRATLGFEPRIEFADGLSRFLNWASTGGRSAGSYESSLEELRARGLMHGG